ncbi:MAG: MmcQ/YjbR family DNA-binding protein [Ignavibacteriales bacterium]|nr:MmcQ/YjbR family DNA-binding protein [Ignavibacteriales bacterium]
MINIDVLRQLVMRFPDTTEEPHFEKISFRVNKKIFATFDEKNDRAVVKLSLTDQSVFCSFDKAIMYPVKGTWGGQGWTVVELNKVKRAMLKDALKSAYQNVAAKKKKK